jgi:light-regulated signal transduction histidine kinase (bacteriophytochrome)
MNFTTPISSAFFFDPPLPSSAGKIWSGGGKDPPVPQEMPPLESKVKDLEAKVKELEAFSYSVAHDLRAPLRSIAGFTGILVEEYAAGFDAEGRRLLGVICRETRRMEQLIEDFLNFSRLGGEPIQALGVDMTACARGAFQELVAVAPAEAPEIEIGALPPSCGDGAMVRQVFANLLGNAIKFTQSRARPRIEITGSTVGDWNTYCVADNGVGFNPLYTHKLFGVFQRLHSQKEFPGSGVGLALVQHVVQRHGGRAWAEGEVNVGAKFYFTLPHHQKS